MIDMKYYTLKEAAEFLGKSVRTLKYWCKSGKFVPEIKCATGQRGGRGKCAKYTEVQLKSVQKKSVQKVCNGNGQSVQSELATVSKCAIVRFAGVLPSYHFSGVTKLMRKLQVVEIGQGFKTTFDRARNLYTFARLDYADEKVSFNGRFDVADELILNALYSITRNAKADSDGSYPVGEKPTFSSRRILQHIFGNAAANTNG